MDREFDKAKGGFHDFTICRGQKDNECLEHFLVHFRRDIVFNFISSCDQESKRNRSYIPLNSKTSFDNAVIVALIICGVAPANPPAIIMRNSWRDAVAIYARPYQYTGE